MSNRRMNWSLHIAPWPKPGAQRFDDGWDLNPHAKLPGKPYLKPKAPGAFDDVKINPAWSDEYKLAVAGLRLYGNELKCQMEKGGTIDRHLLRQATYYLKMVETIENAHRT